MIIHDEDTLIKWFVDHPLGHINKKVCLKAPLVICFLACISVNKIWNLFLFVCFVFCFCFCFFCGFFLLLFLFCFFLTSKTYNVISRLKGAWHENFEKLILLKLIYRCHQFSSKYLIDNEKIANLYLVQN